jgi:hypothetical protein
MKNLFLIRHFIIGMTLMPVLGWSQNCFWSENFDAPSLRDSCTTVFNGTHGFAQNSRLFVSAQYSDTSYIGVGDTIELRTDCFDLTGMTYAILSFNHICKVDFFDMAIVEISLDCGQTWYQLTTEYITDVVNPPGAPFSNQGYKFSAASYAAWQPANPLAVPTNTWWRTEYFDISGWAGFPDTRIRFIMWDANVPGGNGNNGWAIDDICVLAAPCELTPPTFTQLPPVYQGTVYSLGPFTLNATATDNSGINNVTIYYSINGGPFIPVQMTFAGGNDYTGQIPAVNDGDTVCYYFVATDASPCLNQTIYPSTGCIQFVASQGITFPYCDNYDIPPQLWTATTISGTSWSNGVPTNGVLAGAYTAPNVWAVGLTSNYSNNTTAYLYSPVFGPMPVGTKLSFYIKYQTETSYDGTRLEYSTNGGTTWSLLGDLANTCGCQVNWYTNTIFSSNQPAWAGTQNTWMKVEYTFTSSFPFGANIQFRFVFTSDASITGNGVAIDNFCIITPQPFDAGVQIINQPSGFAAAGSCQPVTVTIQNYGLNPFTSLNLYYATVQGGNTNVSGPFAWSGTLGPGQTVQVSLPCVTFLSGSFSFCVWTNLTNDGNGQNDTNCVSLLGVTVIPVSYTQTYCDNFDGINPGWVNTLLPGGSSGTNWQLGTPAYGSLVGAYSPPNAWGTNLTSAYTNSANVALVSPIFDFSNAVDAKMTFRYRHNTESGWDGVLVQYSLNGTTWTTIGGANPPAQYYTNWYNANMLCANAWGFNGNSQGWKLAEMKNLGILPGVNNAPAIQFRFVFCSDASVTGEGFLLDDFCLEVPVPITAAPVTLFSNASFPLIFQGQSLQFSAHLKNKGTTPLSSLQAQLWIDGVLVVTDQKNYSPPLPPNDSSLHTFSYVWTATPGMHTICVVTANPNGTADLNPTDDTLCYQLQVIASVNAINTGVCTDFENAPQFVTYNALNYNPNTSWQWGTPAQTVLNAAYSGTKAWMTHLTSNYPNADSSGLFSDLFSIDPNHVYRLSFYHKFNTELFADGGAVDYSTDYGVSWQQLGVFSPTTWYNYPFVTALGGLPPQPGFTGALGTYVQASWQQIFGASSVIFRFRFMSDMTITNEGWVIDDVCFTDLGPLTTTGHLPEKASFAVFPNPASDFIYIHFYQPVEYPCIIYLTDVTGRMVKTLRIPASSRPDEIIALKVSDLESGVYFITVDDSLNRITQRIIIAD